MITIHDLQNAVINRVKKTIFVVREDGVYCGQYSVNGHNASPERCLQHYLNQQEEV